jgi:branched-chain amino acid aminotransferase
MIEFDLRPTGHPVPDHERDAIVRSPEFGKVFTDHMITIRWTAAEGWHDARLEAYGPFTLDPATSVFHYPPRRQRRAVQFKRAPDGDA